MLPILKDIQNTYHDAKYCNVVGIASDMEKFVSECKQNRIWFYRVCTFFVYQGTYFKIVFLKKKDEPAIKNLIAGKNLVLNASNPF